MCKETAERERKSPSILVLYMRIVSAYDQRGGLQAENGIKLFFDFISLSLARFVVVAGAVADDWSQPKCLMHWHRTAFRRFICCLVSIPPMPIIFRRRRLEKENEHKKTREMIHEGDRRIHARYTLHFNSMVI